MNKYYRVVKAFAALEKGDILTYNEDSELYEFEYEDDSTHRATYMDSNTIDEFVDEGYLLCFSDEEDCECCGGCVIASKLEKINELAEDLLKQYESDHNEVVEKYSNQEIPTCVKVEADTVYFNLTKVLNKIKDIIDE